MHKYKLRCRLLVNTLKVVKRTDLTVGYYGGLYFETAFQNVLGPFKESFNDTRLTI